MYSHPIYFLPSGVNLSPGQLLARVVQEVAARFQRQLVKSLAQVGRAGLDRCVNLLRKSVLAGWLDQYKSRHVDGNRDTGIESRRCVAMTVQSSAAYLRASSRPIPLFAPVIRTGSATAGSETAASVMAMTKQAIGV